MLIHNYIIINMNDQFKCEIGLLDVYGFTYQFWDNFLLLIFLKALSLTIFTKRKLLKTCDKKLFSFSVLVFFSFFFSLSLPVLKS